MKTLKLSLLASAMILGSFAVKAQSADELMSKHIAAMGGDAWKKISSMKKVSGLSMQGMDMEMTETRVKDKGFRTDISVMGTENYVIITPTGGWTYMPMQGATKPEELKAEDLAEAKSQMEIGYELADYKAEGVKAELSGKEDINGKSAHKLTLTDKEGKKQTIFLDAGNYYIVRQTSTEATPAGEVEVTTDFSEFKKFPEGIVVAMKAKNDYQELTVKSVELNKPVDDSAFKPSN